ncbi:serine hydrolase [Mesosutterella sp. AGMB02718]|uniref:Serine hydrolase n=1 Tax=Mesosutterella faecium TaxID=2925194 RepID=A0ABT7ILD3_9BURK|nr:D-alanyl-D-alanine carboxypeptidase family protein [Mesosutterella sp. AGMB02718]MDL2059179.1 serine hydrolase [Mesosutterella sp. AGMB02718]
MPCSLKKVFLGVLLSCFALTATQSASARAERGQRVESAGQKAKAPKRVAVQKKKAKAPSASQRRRGAAEAAPKIKAPKGAKKSRKTRSAASSGVVKTSLNRAPESTASQIPADQFVAQNLRSKPSSSGKLMLDAACAFMLNQDNGRILFEKNADSQLPVASLTKLMSALVIMRSNLSMSEPETVQKEDYYLPSSSFSRLRIGMTLSRSDLLHVALTGSDNRAIHTLARTFPGGMNAFVQKMNDTARELGLKNTSFEEPTGLSVHNRSTAREIARIAAEAYRYPTIREYSTTPNIELPTQAGIIHVRSTNRLIREGRDWNIGLQKTGYTGAAGHCMVLQSQVDGNRVLMVVLNSTSNNARINDVKKLRSWYEQQLGVKMGAARLPYNLM